MPLLVGRGYRCVVPELPLGGHLLPLRDDADLTPPGLARLLVDVLDALRLRQLDVVGVDTGGALTQLLMADHRDRVRRVVLTACDAYEHFPPRTPVGRLFTPLFRWPVLGLASNLLRLRPARRVLTIIAWGDDDRLFPRHLAQRLHSDLPDARLVIIDDCAAFAAIDQPEALTALIDEHLSR